jgi:hypothetical protein
MFSTLVLYLSLGLVRNNMLLLFDQNLDQGSKFSSKIKVLRIASKQMVHSPHRHEPNATCLGSNGRHMSEISRSVRIVKQAKKNCADCTVRTDADVAEVHMMMWHVHTLRW